MVVAPHCSNRGNEALILNKMYREGSLIGLSMHTLESLHIDN